MEGYNFLWLRFVHLVFAICLFLPLACLAYVIFIGITRKISKKVLLGIGALFSFLSLPVLVVLLTFPDGLQSLLSFGVYSSVNVPGYRIAFVESPCFLGGECERHFEIINDAGTEARYFIDGDSNRCNGVTQVELAPRIFFACDGEQFPGVAAYINVEKMFVVTGYSRQVEPLR